MKRLFALLTALVLLAGLSACTIRIRDLNIGISGENISGSYTYDDAKDYFQLPQQGKTVEIGGYVKTLFLDWISGSVEIKSGDSFTISETAEKGEYFPMYYLVKDDTAYLKYAKSGTANKYLDGKAKRVVITVPEGCSDMNLVIVSARYTVNVDHPASLEAAFVSGSAEISMRCPKKIALNGVSGNVNISAGDTSQLESIDVEQVSGNTYLKLDAKRGYELSYASVSGKLRQDFSEGTDSSLKKYSVRVNTVSGNLSIEKLQ